MAITQTMYVLGVQSLVRSGEYYEKVLGFEVREMGDPGWRMFVKDECRIMAGECPDMPSAASIGDHSYFGYLVVDDVDAYCEQARQNGAEVFKPLRSEPWDMREFGVRTIDGHRIMIGQSLKRE